MLSNQDGVSSARDLRHFNSQIGFVVYKGYLQRARDVWRLRTVGVGGVSIKQGCQ